MKKLLIILFITGSMFQAEAKAKEIVVYYGNASSFNHGGFLGGDFATNKELGRAWVTLDFASPHQDGSGDEVRVQIPGMSFDQTTKEVIIDTEEGRIVCAYEKRALFGIKVLKKTNNCQFKESFSTVQVDDGYTVYKIQKRTISFFY